MGLFRKDKKEAAARNYPTKEEYLAEINKIQSEELNSDRYAKVRKSLENHYWDRENKDLEEELFKIVGTYGLEDPLINKSDEYQKSVRLKRYAQLKKFFEGLSEEQINSNIFLKIANLYMKISVEECKEMISQLNLENPGKSFRAEYFIPETTQKHLPDYVNTQCGVLYYDPSAYKTDYVDVLDSSHISVYRDYNDLVEKITRIAEDIYFLELNYQIVRNFNNLICYHFQIYHPGHDNKFIVSFYLHEPQKSINEDKPVVEEDFVETTINNFQSLIDLGIIDITASQEEKGTPYVLKRKQ